MTEGPALHDGTAPRASRAFERWIGLRRRARAPRARLIAFSYAGGGASAYRRWITDLGHADWLDFAAIQLPGRETRLAEPPFTELAPLLDNLERALRELLDLPFVLLGYSMGATVAYELTVRLLAQRASPELLIVAARPPPWRTGARNHRPAIGRDELVARILRMGATAPALVESDVFDRYYLPTLQADFTLVDSFRRTVPQIVPCPILALAGSSDPDVSVDDVSGWASAAGRGFTLEQFNAGHFFLHHAHDDVVATVTSAIQGSCTRRLS